MLHINIAIGLVLGLAVGLAAAATGNKFDLVVRLKNNNEKANLPDRRLR